MVPRRTVYLLYPSGTRGSVLERTTRTSRDSSSFTTPVSFPSDRTSFRLRLSKPKHSVIFLRWKMDLTLPLVGKFPKLVSPLHWIEGNSVLMGQIIPLWHPRFLPLPSSQSSDNVLGSSVVLRLTGNPDRVDPVLLTPHHPHLVRRTGYKPLYPSYVFKGCSLYLCR